MIVLITNDDGIDAPGLSALAQACQGWESGPRICRPVIVAPSEPHSGCGHRVTTDRPLVLREVGPDRYSVDGTPADCVRLALATLLTPPGRIAGNVAGPARPTVEWVLSGINEGGNLGVDVHHSGTVAAAREAALHGVAAVAASQYRSRREPVDWRRAAAWMRSVLAELMSRPLEPGAFWNVNLPHPPAGEAFASPPPIVECAIDPSPLPLDYASAPEGWLYRSRYHDRMRVAGADVATCFGGAISLSRGRVV